MKRLICIFVLFTLCHPELVEGQTMVFTQKHTPNPSQEGNYAPKKFYLIDSLDLTKLAPEDKLLLDSCLKVYHTAKHDTDKVNALSGICENMMDDNWQKYQFFQYELIEKKLATKPSILVAKALRNALSDALNNIGYLYDSQGQIENALKYYRKSLKIDEEIGNKQGIATSLNSIGLIIMNQGDIPKALEYYHKSLKIREEIGDKQGVASSLNNIGLINMNQGNIPKALEYYQKSLKILEEIGYKRGIAYTLKNIGLINMNQGEIPKALEYFHKCLKIYEEIGDKQGAAESLNNIGYIYNNQNDILKALEYYHKSLKIREKIGDKKGIAESFNNIGYIYNIQGDPSVTTSKEDALRAGILKALEYHHKSLKIREEIGNKQGIASSLNNIGGIYSKHGDPFLTTSKEDALRAGIPKALEYYHKSLKIYEEIGDKRGVALALNNIGGVYLKQKQLPKAIEYAQKSMLLANELGYPENIRNAAELLSKTYEKQGKGLEALEMHKLYITMQDSINNEENEKAAAQQQAKYEYEKQKTIDDAQHEKQLAIEQEAQAKQKVITYATAGGLGLVVIFLIFVFNRLQVTKRQKVVIETQKFEVEQQKEVVEKAHLLLEEKNNEILASIRYAKRIQDALMTSQKYMERNINRLKSMNKN